MYDGFLYITHGSVNYTVYISNRAFSSKMTIAIVNNYSRNIQWFSVPIRESCAK